MKNFISYYYNLYVKTYKKREDNFEFRINDNNYRFIPFYGDINKLSKVYLILKNNNKYCHEIVFNRNNSMLTMYNEKTYILIKENSCLEKCITIGDIVNYDLPVFDNYSLDWKNKWEVKVDYYEYQMSQMGFKYSLIKNSFDYYCGLTECAICLLNYISQSKINYSICHSRIRYNEKLCEFYNPVELIIDNRTRDIAEYIKINYINENITLDEVYNIIDGLYFKPDEIILLLSRLIYPSYYFDLYDKIIEGKIDESKIDMYIKKNAYYETFLKKTYLYLKQRYHLPEIEWLNCN